MTVSSTSKNIPPLRVLDIVEGTSVDGPGLRTAIYFSGCLHHCPGCHNPQSWDMEAGAETDTETLMKVILFNDFNVTFTGGDPMYRASQLSDLARRIKEAGKTLWCYTGFKFEDIYGKPQFTPLLDYVDVLVDGRYEDDLRDNTLLFRGSSNQRIIKVPESTPWVIIPWEPTSI